MLLYVRHLFDESFMEGRLNFIQARPGEGLKEIRNRFVRLRAGRDERTQLRNENDQKCMAWLKKE